MVLSERQVRGMKVVCGEKDLENLVRTFLLMDIEFWFYVLASLEAVFYLHHLCS